MPQTFFGCSICCHYYFAISVFLHVPSRKNTVAKSSSIPILPAMEARFPLFNKLSTLSIAQVTGIKFDRFLTIPDVGNAPHDPPITHITTTMPAPKMLACMVFLLKELIAIPIDTLTSENTANNINILKTDTPG